MKHICVVDCGNMWYALLCCVVSLCMVKYDGAWPRGMVRYSEFVCVLML